MAEEDKMVFKRGGQLDFIRRKSRFQTHGGIVEDGSAGRGSSAVDFFVVAMFYDRAFISSNRRYDVLQCKSFVNFQQYPSKRSDES